jgi:hypothetical protein
MIGTKSIKGIETCEGNTPFNKQTKYVNYWIIKTDSLGNIQRLATGSYNNMKAEYLKHNYTSLDGYYIVEVLSTIQRAVK